MANLRRDIKEYIQQEPRSRTEVYRKFQIPASELDDIIEDLKSSHIIIERHIQTEGKHQIIYKKPSRHQIDREYFSKIEYEKARRVAENYMKRYDIPYPECSVPECDNKATHIRHHNPQYPYAVTFLCKECNDFLRNDELFEFANPQSLKDLRKEKPRSRNASQQYLRRYIAKYAIEKPPCQICGATENVRAHIEDLEYPLEVSFVCPSCQGKIITHNDWHYPEPINVDSLIL